MRSKPVKMFLIVAVVTLAGCSDKSTNPSPSAELELDSAVLAAGQVFEHTFDTAGMFPYHCAIHPSVMKGNQIIVSATATDTLVSVSIVGASTPGFAPSSVTIKPGGTIRWTNDDGIPHTVTSDS